MTQLTIQELHQNFQVIRILGEGSFGKVFLVRHNKTNQQFALKKYSWYQINKVGKQKSLVRSSRILSSLQHHNIIKFQHYIMGNDDQFYLMYQSCTKGSLESIKNIINLNYMEFIKLIMYQLAQALLYLKSVAVAHRDLKPANISFNSNGELKLIDFDEATCYKDQILKEQIGLSKQKVFEQQNYKGIFSRRSRANSFVGTQLYMSPQMKNNTVVDERGDIWAFGCIFYQLISNQILFSDYLDGDEEDEKIVKKIGILLQKIKQMPVYQNIKQQVHEAIDLIKKVLRSNPVDRLSVQNIVKHEFFKNFKYQRPQISNKFKKFLRSNFTLTPPKQLQQALSNNLIGMKTGKQKFQYLKYIPVFVHMQTDKQTSLFHYLNFNAIRNFFRKDNILPFPKIWVILGGASYFKIKNPEAEDDKMYIYYRDIDSISIVNEYIVIKTSNQNYQLQEDESNFHMKYYLRFLTDQISEQTKLFQLLNQIIKD